MGTGKSLERRSALVATLVALLAAAALACCMAVPGTAHASVKRGTMEISVADSLSLDCGTTAALACTVTPESERQRPCCSTDYCPSGCDVGAGCLDNEGFCTCLGGSYFTAYANCAVTSSAPNVARASWSNGVLTVKGYHEGVATISITAKMTLWVSQTAQVVVTVGPPPGGSGEGDGAGNAAGDGNADDSNAGSTPSNGGSSGTSGDATNAPGGAKSSNSGGSGDTSSTKKSSNSSSKSSTSSSKGNGKSSTSASSKTSTSSSTSSQGSTSGTQATSGVAAVSAVSAARSTQGGTNGTPNVVSVGQNANTTPDDSAADDDPGDEATETEDADEGSVEEQAEDEPADEMADIDGQDMAASAVSTATAGQTGTRQDIPASGAVIGAMALIAAAGTTVRYRMNMREHELLAAEDDPEDED